MSDRKRCCCNCGRCIRTWDGGNCTTRCDVDGHYIGYVECFEGWCRHWAKDKWQEEGADDEQAGDNRTSCIVGNDNTARTNYQRLTEED